jgi:hypothetical protein
MSASPVPSPVLMLVARSAILATRPSAIGSTATQALMAMLESCRWSRTALSKIEDGLTV